MAHAAARFGIGTGILFATLALGVMTTVTGWAETLLGDRAPLASPAATILRFTMAAGLVGLAGRQVIARWGWRAERDEVARMRQDLAYARRVQERFLPQCLPDVPGIDIWGENQSSLEVSGDYYDVHDPGGGRPLLLAIADVSGKGFPAALLMSVVQAGLRSHLLDGELDIERAMRNLNRLVHHDAQPGRFVTMLLAEFDKSTGRLRYIRAGHDLPVIVSRDGSVRRLEEGNVFLGFLPEVEYRAAAADLRPGDTLCLYTDGVTEATDPAGEQFDEKRLVRVLVENRHRSAETIGRSVLEAVAAHSRRTRQVDDVTLLIVKLSPDAAAHPHRTFPAAAGDANRELVSLG